MKTENIKWNEQNTEKNIVSSQNRYQMLIPSITGGRRSKKEQRFSPSADPTSFQTKPNRYKPNQY